MREDTDLSKFFISVAGALVNLFVALILLLALLYLVLVLISDVEGINKFQTLATKINDTMTDSSEIMTSLLTISVTALALAFLVMFVRWVSKDEVGITILPFEVHAGEEKYSGKALSHLLTAELIKIRQIHETEYEGVIPIKQENLKLPVLVPYSENLTYTISQMGYLNLGSTSIPLGPLMVAFKRLWPRDDKMSVISGSLQKYGLLICLEAYSESKEIRSWTVIRKVRNRRKNLDEQIPYLVRDLAFKIALDISNITQSENVSKSNSKSSTSISAKTYLGLRYFTDALDAYKEYYLSGKIRYLDISNKNAIKSANAEIGYELPFALLYNLGIANLNEHRYKKAEQLFLKASKIKQDFGVYFALGFCYDKLGKNDEAENYYEETIKLNPNHSGAWNNLSLLLRKNLPQKSEEGRKAIIKKAICYLDKSHTLMSLEHVYSCKKKQPSNQKRYEKCEEIKDYITDNHIQDEYIKACFDAMCGDEGEALKWIQKALNKNKITPEWAQMNPYFEFIRSNPCFKRIVTESADE